VLPGEIEKAILNSGDSFKDSNKDGFSGKTILIQMKGERQE
jgi:hypothetical protein